MSGSVRGLLARSCVIPCGPLSLVVRALRIAIFMNPLDVIKAAQSKELVNEDGGIVELELLPPLTEAEINDFASSLPCKFPEEIHELLKYCRGFEGIVDLVDFTGQDLSFGFESIFPHGLPIASDGFGNFWVVDLQPNSTSWAPIYFFCHDAPIVVYQAGSLAYFLQELFRMFIPPHESEINEVHEDRIANIWAKNPGVLPYETCLNSSDAILSDFAKGLDESYQVIDLRNAKVGDGFSWGRYGPNTVIKRYGYLPIFAYEKKGFLKRLLGGNS